MGCSAAVSSVLSCAAVVSAGASADASAPGSFSGRAVSLSSGSAVGSSPVTSAPGSFSGRAVPLSSGSAVVLACCSFVGSSAKSTAPTAAGSIPRIMTTAKSIANAFWKRFFCMDTFLLFYIFVNAPPPERECLCRKRQSRRIVPPYDVQGIFRPCNRNVDKHLTVHEFFIDYPISTRGMSREKNCQIIRKAEPTSTSSDNRPSSLSFATT